MTENVSMGTRLDPVADLVGKTVILLGESTGKRGVIKSQNSTQDGHQLVCVEFPDGSFHDCLDTEIEVVSK